MRDWRNWDPGYSSNDASHPRNRPRGAGVANDVLELDPATSAAMLAGLRALAGGPPRRAPASGGGAGAGHQATAAERRRAYAEYERVRVARDARVAAEPRMAAQLAAKTAGWPCRWWAA